MRPVGGKVIAVVMVVGWAAVAETTLFNIAAGGNELNILFYKNAHIFCSAISSYRLL